VLTVETTFAENCKEDGYFERRVYTWTATDVCGNSSTITFTVDIIDDTPPVFIVFPSDITIVCAPLPPPAVVFTDGPIQSVTIEYLETIVPGAEPGVFIVTRQWTATDICGNVTVYIQHIKWIPDTSLECNIVLPGPVECNTHGVLLGSYYTGGLGPVTYHWEIVGKKCFIQGSPDSSEILIYIGWSQVKIFLTVTDSFGCVSMCMTTLGCDFSLDKVLSEPSAGANPEADAANGTSKDNLQQLNLWPNPANESVNLSFESSVEKEVEFSLINFLGQVILRDKISAYKGFNAHKIDVTKIIEGSYLLQLKTKEEMHTKVIVIMLND